MKKTILFLLVILACQVMYAGTIDVNINEDHEKIELEEGHTWVCDGFEVDRRQMIYKLYVIATSHILEYVLACDPYQGEILSEGYFFHMNWGQRLSSNGWYLEGPLAVDDIYYNNNRIDITDIRNSTELN